MKNNYKTLTLNGGAIEELNSALIDQNWFKDHNLVGSANLKRVALGEDLYILSDNASLEDNYLVINLRIFKDKYAKWAPEILTRALRVGLKTLNRGIAVPKHWQPFYDGPVLAIYAYADASPGGARLHFDQDACGSGQLYASVITTETISFNDVEFDRKQFTRAWEKVADAILADKEMAPDVDVGAFGILLSEPLEDVYFASGDLAEWLENKLNPEQMEFVDKPHLDPVRLRGAAGTGKTQAMAVKCLKDLYDDDDAGGDKSFAFLTHSAALAHDVLRSMFHSLDPDEKWAKLRTRSGRPKLWFGTLYEMAENRLNFIEKGLEPLSLDGREGRAFQELLISDSIANLRKDPEAQLRAFPAGKFLAERIDVDALSPALISDIQNEFACSLDAENVRRGNDASEKYLKAPRQTWQMKLPTEADRDLLLLIYEEYRRQLRDAMVLSMDQLIADFARYLNTHEWDQLKEDQGYDVLFVDEYHYFNRLETMTFQKLFKQRAAQNGRWPVFMAYDLKQSTTDGSIGGGIQRFKNPGIGVSTSVVLDKVYRSTPQIGEFLADLDASFPTLDLEGEYALYSGISQKDPGDTPKLLTFETNVNLIDEVTSLAQRMARDIDGKGREVAILCANSELFDIYRKAGRIRDRIVSIESREDLKELRYSKSRCVFSMPEYVAGLQFEIVFLIHLDKSEIIDEDRNLYQWRQHLSRAYLGATRAKSKLFIASSNERGGPSPVILQPLKNGTLIKE